MSGVGASGVPLARTSSRANSRCVRTTAADAAKSPTEMWSAFPTQMSSSAATRHLCLLRSIQSAIERLVPGGLAQPNQIARRIRPEALAQLAERADATVADR